MVYSFCEQRRRSRMLFAFRFSLFALCYCYLLFTFALRFLLIASRGDGLARSGKGGKTWRRKQTAARGGSRAKEAREVRQARCASSRLGPKRPVAAHRSGMAGGRRKPAGHRPCARCANRAPSSTARVFQGVRGVGGVGSTKIQQPLHIGSSMLPCAVNSTAHNY